MGVRVGIGAGELGIDWVGVRVAGSVGVLVFVITIGICLIAVSDGMGVISFGSVTFGNGKSVARSGLHAETKKIDNRQIQYTTRLFGSKELNIIISSPEIVSSRRYQFAQNLGLPNFFRVNRTDIKIKVNTPQR